MRRGVRRQSPVHRGADVVDPTGQVHRNPQPCVLVPETVCQGGLAPDDVDRHAEAAVGVGDAQRTTVARGVEHHAVKGAGRAALLAAAYVASPRPAPAPAAAAPATNAIQP